ncbi:MAG TPA: DUF3108 domain-containing protein [Opitutus sp.]|nr:DUF3108 domain-containing protein [Opitutus sp.]
MNVVRFAGLLLFCAACAAHGKLALEDGEQLTYRVAWGVFGNAGEIKINASVETNDGVPNLVVSTTTETRGVLKRIYPFEARGESIFDLRTGRLMVLTEASAGGKKKTNIAVEFDYRTSTARFTDFFNSERSRTFEFPKDSELSDLITSLIQTRSWDLKPGEKRDLDVVFEKDIYQLTVHAIGYETVETRMGKYRAVVLQPRMEKTPPKGMFRRGSRVHVWIAQDDSRKLPVKFEVEFKFGAGVATLLSYTPPTNSAPAVPSTR